MSSLGIRITGLALTFSLLAQLSDSDNTAVHTATHGACFKKGKKSLYIPKLNKIKVFLLNTKVFYLFLVTNEHWMLKGSYLMRQLTFSIHTYYTNKIKVHF